ncbi:MAG: winged helix-turn-helix transcriptional regulator [Candidatus Buchananbacteria bacterium]|nr:winged helix-turn-helix transcriptional regulator [Candidatus Buchananbacteria bacterium]
MSNIKTIFDSLDLPSKTCQIYEFIVKNGPVSASSIAKGLSMPRPTVYLYIDELIKIGLISTTGSIKKRKLIAENPNNLINLVEKKVETFSQLIPLAEKAAKSMADKLFTGKYNIPEIKFYIGKEGARNIIEASLNTKNKEILGIISIYNIYELLGEKFLKEYTQRRIKKGIRIKNIWPGGEIPALLKNHKEQLRDVRISYNLNDFTASFLTYDDVVIIITSLDELLTVQIKSRDLSQAIKILFQLQWDVAKKENDI